MKRFAVTVLMIVSGFMYLQAQTAIQTSFESAEGFTLGNLHNQNGWTVTAGTHNVYTTKTHNGTQSANLTAPNTALRVDRIPYSGTVPGITGNVYADIWVNPSSITTRNFAINGFDLYGGSARRIFVIEFTSTGLIRAFNGSSSSTTNIGNWVANQWVRISVKVNFTTEKYKVAVNTLLYGTELSFRETYTPTGSGTRVAGVKEFHSLRFNHLTDTDVSTTDVTVDDIYVGTTPIADVDFEGASTIRTITVTQPAFGSIALNPASGPYVLNQAVTATLTLPQGYQNNGWTGDLTGTALVQNFTVTNNMAFSANVGIDINNPPPKYKVTAVQPANGTITLLPASPDSMYYKETPITATVSFDACYQFNGWSGDVSGTQNPKSITVQNDLNFGADVVLSSTVPVKRIASTVTEFKNALLAMNPGDSIEVNDGSYKIGLVTVTRSACALRPIHIYAKNPGQVILNGTSSFLFRSLKNVTLSGFSFESVSISTGVKLENCNKVRITGNSFKYTETASCTWVYIGDTYGSTEPLRSGYNRIDHNTFDGKTEAGNFIRLDGNIDQQTRYDTIDHNWFKNNGPRAVNEKESIRVGVSTLSQSSGYTLIEYNLFQDCDGDPEIVSVKSWNNTVRYNTFRRCLGTVTLRQGNGSTVEGNYFFGEGKINGTNGCGGVRVYGKDHKVINNYFQELTGYKWDAAITVTNGDVYNNSTNFAAHFVPENLVVAFNTLVNNFSNIEIGFTNNGSYDKAPINCQLANNIVIDNLNPIVKSYSAASLAGVALSNNIMYPTGTSSLGITATTAEINVTDPMLVQPACDTPVVNCNLTYAYKVLRLQTGSPAINAATGSYPYLVADYERQQRSGAKDIGADEYNGNSPIYTSALDSTHVGPNAINFDYSYFYGALPIKLVDFTARYANKKTELKWQVSEEINVKHYEIEWGTNGHTFSKINTEAATAAGVYQSQHANPVTGKNFYRLKILDNDGKYAYSPIRMINTENKNDLNIYPNPARQFIHADITGTVTAGTQLNLVNALGITVKRFTINAPGIYNLGVQGLPAGNYRLTLINAGQETKWAVVSIVQ